MKRRQILPTIGDLVIYAVIAVFIMLFFFVQLRPRQEKPCFVRIQSGEKVEQYDLYSDREILVEGEGHSLTISISSGTVRVIDADCPDRLCMKTGTISEIGKSIVCLPARVIVTIEGGDGADEAVVLP